MVEKITHGLGFEVNGKTLLRDINLVVAPSGITVIMGPNGAGKSLLLRLLHGLLAPTVGSITWANGAHQQAMVFQKPVLLRRSVAANVDFGLTASGTADGAFRDALLEQVGLLEKADVPARRLSGGEQQRLAIARALATRPKVLFLDEPTASLDPASSELIETLVKDIAGRGVRVLFVTHDIGQGRRLADDVVFLSDGRVVEHRPAPKFFETPETAQAHAYLSGQFFLQGVQSS